MKQRKIALIGDMKTFVYIGNWRAKTAGRNGFGIFRFDEATAELTWCKHALSDVSVSAVYLNTKTNILYCANELTNAPGGLGGGQVLAVKLDPESGDMTEISRSPSYGANPTGIALDPGGRYMLVTHHAGYLPVTKVGRDPYGKYRIYPEYDDTNTVLFLLREDGSIGEPCDVWKHIGHGPLLKSQANPHVHSIMISPNGRFFAACDKGSDRVCFFRINYEDERLVLINDYQSLPGSSPRYSCFHPSLPYWYFNNESMTVIRAFRYDDDGRLYHICTVDTLPDGCENDPLLIGNQHMIQSDIQIHPSGKFIYTMMRSISYVSVFAVDQDTGALRKIQSIRLNGSELRTCAFSPDGRFLLTAVLDAGEVSVFSVGSDGKLSETDIKANQPSPGTVTFFKP